MKQNENNILVRFYSTRSNEEQVLLLSSIFSMALLIFRLLYTGSLLFVFLSWNLFLAFVPYLISKHLANAGGKWQWWQQVLLGLVWLLFIPNSFYLITDLFHLDKNEIVPLWYDLALLLSFAWSGILFGILSVRQMEKLFESFFRKKSEFLFLAPLMLLNGFGVYVGRYLRFNSWDVITDPFMLIRDIIYLFIHPIRSRFDWSMIICYTILLMLIYYTLKKLSKAL
jgi:uncharacterized membrane protein